MLVAVYEVIVCAVVEKDEPEADREAAHGRASPADFWVGGPGEDEEADGNAPT